MAGIAGVIYKAKTESLTPVLSKMSDSLKHRGATHKTVILEGRIGFAARQHEHSAYRAAIFESDSCVVAFDGNIQNTEELHRYGDPDAMNCPAHLAWKGYLAEGLQFFDRIDGSFAAVIYDRRKNVVVLARDIFGQRPLYYGFDQGNFWFASEMKGILAAREFTPVVNRAQIASSLSFGVTIGPDTLHENVFKVIPGYTMVGRPGEKLDCRLFFRPENIQPAVGLERMEDYADRIWQVLGENVAKQLNGSSKNGLFLSSGIDSALVALNLSESCGSQGLAITCGYRDSPGHDESEVAASIAEYCGMQFRNVLTGSEDDILGSFSAVIHQMEIPTRFSIAIPIQRALTRFQDDIGCLLTGDFADLFFGYDDHPYARLHGQIRSLPYPLRGVMRLALAALRRIGVATSFAARFRTANVGSLKDYTLNTWKVYSDGSGLFEQPDNRALAPHVSQLIPHTQGLSVDTQWSLIAMSTLVHCWNELFETLGSAVEMDAINPFQSRTMLSIAYSMPYEFKFSNGVTKPAMRCLASKKFSSDFAHMQKKIFSSPLYDWMRGSTGLRQALIGLGTRDAMINEYLDHKRVREIIKRFETGAPSGPQSRHAGQLLFSLLGFELWLQKFARS